MYDGSERIIAMLKYLLFILIMMFGVFVQSAAGFGGPLLAMPLGIVLLGIDLTKPVSTVVAWITGILVLVSEYKHINRKELFKMTAVMMVGVLAGLWLTGKVQLKFLLLLYAVIVIGIGGKKLLLPSREEAPVWMQNLSLAVAGIMQGLFVSGGSFLAVYSVARIKEKQAFRATVGSVWAVLNTVMVAAYFIDGVMTPEVLKLSGISLIPTIITVWLAGRLTKKIRQETFLKLVYVVLIVSGIVLFITNL